MPVHDRIGQASVNDELAQRRSSVWWSFMAFFAAMTAPICNALLSLRIPLLRLELAVLIAVLAAVAMTAALLTTRLPRYVQALFYAFAVICFLDVAYGGNQGVRLAQLWGASFQWMGINRDLGRMLVIAALVACAYLPLYLLGANAAIVLATVFGAILLSTFLVQKAPRTEQWTFERSRAASATADSTGDRPVVVVLLFDELMSVGALPDAGVPRSAAELRQRVREFHRKYGFRLHTHAYSRHYWTQDSISDLLNFDFTRTSKIKPNIAKADAGSLAARMTGNRLFAGFAERGYAIKVFQSDHIHYCDHAAVTSCMTLDSYNPLSRYLEATPFEHSKILVGAVLSSIKDSYVVNTLNNRVPFFRDLERATYFDTRAFRPWFAKIKQGILGAPPGTLIFAHVLVPHAPHILNDDCSIDFNWINPYALADRLEDHGEVEKIYQESYARYFRQVNCLYSELENLFHQVESQPQLRNATFVITGDHGSRIAKSKYAGVMDERDLLDNYAVHFAVRSPAIEPGIDATVVAMQRLFAEVFDPALAATRFTEEERSILADVKGGKDFARIGVQNFEPAAP